MPPAEALTKAFIMSIATAASVKRALQASADPQRALGVQRFFKSGKGEYGEGDRFLGITVPDQRRIAKQFADLSLKDVVPLLKSPWHEHRLTALLILGMQYPKAIPAAKQAIHDLYGWALRSNYVNNWDLVDSSAEYLMGRHLADEGGAMPVSGLKLLRQMAKSDHLWTRRVAMIATFHGIKRGHPSAAIAIATTLLGDKHDLMHKAVGWMLREVGKRDGAVLRQFLDKHAATMPRTALRYAIERFSEPERRAFLSRVSTHSPKSKSVKTKKA